MAFKDQCGIQGLGYSLVVQTAPCHWPLKMRPLRRHRNDVAVPSGMFASIECLIGTIDGPAELFSFTDFCDPQGDCQRQTISERSRYFRCANRIDNALSGSGGLIGGLALHEHQKLFSAKSEKRLIGTNNATQSARQMTQDDIAYWVTEQVVDSLEMIYIDDADIALHIVALTSIFELTEFNFNSITRRKACQYIPMTGIGQVKCF